MLSSIHLVRHTPNECVNSAHHFMTLVFDSLPDLESRPHFPPLRPGRSHDCIAASHVTPLLCRFTASGNSDCWSHELYCGRLPSLCVYAEVSTSKWRREERFVLCSAHSRGWELVFTSPPLEKSPQRIALNGRVTATALGDKLLAVVLGKPWAACALWSYSYLIITGYEIKIWSCSPASKLLGEGSLCVYVCKDRRTEIHYKLG